MQILVVAATAEEVRGLMSEVGSRKEESRGKNQEPSLDSLEDINPASENPLPTAPGQLPTANCLPPTAHCHFLITGVGMVSTAFALGKHLAINKYDLVINLGIAGSFDRNIALGDLVEITEDTFAELGAEDNDEFLPIDKMGFGKGTYQASTTLLTHYNSYNPSNPYNLKKATAITVNTVHGNEASIKKVVNRLNPQIESMEGAAFFYACREFNVPCIQIRAVSNYVEKRNRDNWKIGLAIKNLNTFAIELIKQFISEP